jgi:LuxR family maltose regulon positive regulatory protein
MPLPPISSRAAPSSDRPVIPHKLSPPLPERLINRWRLVSRMEKARGVIAIVGPPASGKTCLAVSWTRSIRLELRPAEIFWYQIDGGDEDVAVFFELVRVAVAERLGSARALPAYSAEAFVNLRSFASHWFKRLFNQESRASMGFVIDDIHRLPPDSPLILVIGELAKSLGQHDRLVVSSRSVIPTPILNAARRKGLIRISDLQVDETEFEDFERDTDRQRPLTRQAFGAALRHSAHWIAGFPLLSQAKPVNVGELESLPALLSSLSDADRTALATTAYLQVGSEHDWMLLGGEAAVSALVSVGTATALVIRLGDLALRKHDLLFDRLESWATKQLSPDEVSTARAATGRLLLGRGEVLSGVQLLIAAGTFEEASGAILDHASDLIDHAKNHELQQIIQLLPAEERSKPAIQVWAAYSDLPFAPQKAADELADIRLRFHSKLSVSELALAINGEIYGALSSMMIDGRMPLLIEVATNLVGQLIAVKEPMQSRLFLGRVIAILLGHPTYKGLPEIRREAALLLPGLTSESQLILGSALVTHLLWWKGDLEVARARHNQLEAQAHLPDAAHLPVISWHLGALSLAFRDGNGEALLEALTKLSDFAKRRGLSHRLGPAYWIVTQASAALGDYAAAEKALEQHLASVVAMRQYHEHEEHFLRGAVALSRGDLDGAAAEAAVGWSLANGLGAIQGRRQNAIILAMAFALKGDDSASSAIEELAEVGEKTENDIFLVQATLARAALSHAQGRWNDFKLHWRNLVQRSLALGFRSLTGLNVGAVGGMAHDALTHKVDPEGTIRLITLWRLLPPAVEPVNAVWPFPIEINCLGPLELKLDGKQVKIGFGGARQKTVGILALIAGSDAQTLSQPTLMDAAWPEAEADAARNRLKVEIHRLRQLVGRDSIALANGAFTLNDRLIITDVVRLEGAMQTFSDTQRDVFERVAAFDRAIELYRGPLLPGVAALHIVSRREDLADRLLSAAKIFLDTIAQSSAPDPVADREAWQIVREKIRPSR